MEEIKEDTKKKHGRAKTASLIAKICAAALLVVCSILKWKGVFTSCEITEICMVAGTAVGLFVPVDLNIAIDKFKKQGQQHE